ncbi:MAG: hypothetical protein ACOYB2_19565 [Limnohabitans sp.]
MSLYRLDSETKNTEVGVGWSPNTESFFCWVVLRNTGENFNPALSLPCGEMSIDDPLIVVNAILPYSREFDHSSLVMKLRQDCVSRSERYIDLPAVGIALKLRNKLSKLLRDFSNWE